jgi:hypothetical protein
MDRIIYLQYNYGMWEASDRHGKTYTSQPTLEDVHRVLTTGFSGNDVNYTVVYKSR